jgi:hypothetical protein
MYDIDRNFDGSRRDELRAAAFFEASLVERGRDLGSGLGSRTLAALDGSCCPRRRRPGSSPA